MRDLIHSIVRAFTQPLLAMAIVLGAWLPAPAHAFIDNMQIIPTSPVAGVPYRFSVRSGGCHLVFAEALQPFAYSVSGNVVRLTLDVGDNEVGIGFCIFPTVTRVIELPALSEGPYRFEFWRESPIQGIPRQFVTAIDFTVVAGAPEPIAVPTGQPAGWLALALSLLVTGVFVSRWRVHGV